MITRWLVPGKRLNVEFFFCSNFKSLDQTDEETYTIAEIALRLDKKEDIEVVVRNMRMLESEIKLGITSVYHAEKILETKGLTPDEKTGLIQENIAYLIHKRPQDLDYDLFHQMQHFLVMCSSEFKAVREYKHMSRIIYVFYLKRRALRRQVEIFPEKRFVQVRVVKSRLHLPLGVKGVLSLFIGLNFHNSTEVFEERHLLKALEGFIPGVKAIEGSWFVDDFRADNIRLVYLEVVKSDGKDFSAKEIRTLRQALPQELKSRIEQLQRPLFMPRNEEEVMRNIVTLSQQLKYVNDLPQVIITFDEQTSHEVLFTVILARVLKDGFLPIEDLFKKTKSSLTYIPDRIKRAGLIRGKYQKEVTVFRIKMSSHAFLRGDHSVDLYFGRQHLLRELEKVVGEVRDYNGGMISKQLEVFFSLKEALGDLAKKHEFLLENFFHSLQPIEMRAVLEPQVLKKLFLMLHSRLELAGFGQKKSDFMIEEEEKILFVLIATPDAVIGQKIETSIESLQIPSFLLIHLRIQIFDTTFLGLIYYCQEKEKREFFIETLQKAMDV
jgi:hypothetical protein